MSVLRVGTRRSTLARAQTAAARRIIEARAGLSTEEVLVTSRGDVDRTRPLHEALQSGVGLFTAALEDALRREEIDLAVHSLKDLPLAPREDLPVVAIPPREDPRDVLVVSDAAYAPKRAPLPLAPGARVGTSSPRRQTQLLALDDEAVPTDVRGNVDTRLALVEKGVVDAVILARAGLLRAGLDAPKGARLVPLPLDVWPTCPGQGALALQMRADDPRRDLVRDLDDAATRRAVDAERGVLGALGGGCGMPLGATFRAEDKGWRLDATLAPAAWRSSDEPRLARATLTGADAVELAARAAVALRRPAPAAAASAREAPRPLAGRAVLFTFDAETAAPYVAAVERAGGRAAAWPTTAHDVIPLAPVPRDVLDAWPTAQWVLVASPRAARAAAMLHALPREDAPRFGAVGPATARAMRALGLPVHLVAPDGTGAGLAAAVARWTPPEGPVLAPGAEAPRPDLADGLRAAGFEVVPWAVYRTTPLRPLPPPPLPLPADAIVVTAPSAAEALPLDSHAPGELARRWVAFGPSTAETLRARGVLVHAVAGRRSPAAVLECLP